MQHVKVRVRALHDFQGNLAQDQLGFTRGTEFLITEKYENGWWFGTLNNRCGFVPADYLDELISHQGKALYDFHGDSSQQQLSFVAGDVLFVKEQFENGWWFGIHNSKEGFFPASYVEIISTLEANQNENSAIEGEL